MAATPHIGFIGAGNMATAIASGLVETGACSAADLRFAEPNEERRRFIGEHLKAHATGDNGAVAAAVDVLVLSIKPQIFQAVLPEIATSLKEDALVVSIAAGISTAIVERALPGARVVRTMPNTPALVGAGATAMARGSLATDDDMRLVRTLFESVGVVVEVNETELDAVTGLSGSGPAYVFRFAEALAAAGVRAGLAPDVAKALAEQTLWGASKLLHESEDGPSVLRERVTSPGGTTLAGLQRMTADDFDTIVGNAVGAATARSVELREASEGDPDPG